MMKKKENVKFTGSLLPMPLNYGYLGLVPVVNIIKRRPERPNTTSTRNLYYIPETQKFYNYFELIARLKSLDLDFNEWENRWWLHEELYSEKWAEKVVRYRYSDRLRFPETCEIIKNKLLEDHNYVCDFYITRNDLIKMYKETNFRALHIDYDYRLVPEIIESPRTLFDLIYKTDEGEEKIYKTHYYTLIVEEEDPLYFRGLKAGNKRVMGER